MIANYNIRMFRGDDYSFTAQALVNGQPLNLTGATLRLTAKYNTYDLDSAAVFRLSSLTGEISIPTPLTGNFTVTVPASYTASLPAHLLYLPYDLQSTDINGKVSTLLAGQVVVQPDISVTAP